MARRGGYGRDAPGVEWAKLGAGSDAEGKLAAVKLGQDYFTWLNDAVMHHVYRTELLQAQELYQADVAEWMQGNKPGQPLQSDPKYQVTRPKPEITRTHPGQAALSRQRQFRP